MEQVLNIMAGKVERAAETVFKRSGSSPSVGIILGSGQGGFSRRLSRADYIPYREIPYFFQPLVPGHDGVLTVGESAGLTLAVLEGRIHLYEGYFMREIVFPVRVLHRLGVRDLIVCNAAGGLGDRFSVGDVMIVGDQINLMGTNPLIGQIHQQSSDSFLDMSVTYSRDYRELARQAGRELGEDLAEGVLAAVPGPCYETPAESRMLALLGADAVTMSSIPEVTMARYLGMNVLGLSLITNVHGGAHAADHKGVLDIARQRTGFMMGLLTGVVARLATGRKQGERSGPEAVSCGDTSNVEGARRE